MSKPAIVFDQVCKSYQLKAHRRHDTLKEAVFNTARHYLPFGKQKQIKLTQPDNTFWALNNISFEIKQGEAVGIIGPNGSGKSTSLKILSGVTKPTSGRYELNGRLGALLEVGAGFHPDLTGRENVYMNGSILGMSKKEINRKFDSIVDFSEIEKFIDTPVKHYSSGMYVRLGFAVAIHNEPEVMLVDEALAVGDMGFQKKCFTKIREIIDSGRTFVLVSHSMSQIQETCSRTILINKGNLIADGDPKEVAGQYMEISGPPLSQSKPDSNTENSWAVNIEQARVLDHNQNKAIFLPAGSGITLEFDYKTNRHIQSPSFTIKISRGPVTVYAANSAHSEHQIDTLNTQGTVRCTIPPLPLTPNTFDIDIYAVDLAKPGTAIGHLNIREAFSISPPADLLELGSNLKPDRLSRPIVYTRPTWITK